jgi:hypothetical protein
MAALDELAAKLRGSVRRAVAGREQAGLVAQFDAMRREVEDALEPIDEALAALAAPELSLDEEAATELASRRESVRGQLDNLREALAEDPAMIRQGNVWRATREAIVALKKQAVDVRAEAYRAMLASYADGDRELAESLPPGTAGLAEYRAALRAFEGLVERVPRSAAEVGRAANVGRRLQTLREEVEGAVPEPFRIQWRDLRGTGLPLTRLTPEFRVWLDERGLAANVVARYRVE